MTVDESISLVEQHQDKLQLTSSQNKRWAGKRYLVLIEIGEVEEVEPFIIDKSEYGNMDDWLPIGNIKKVNLALYERHSEPIHTAAKQTIGCKRRKLDS